MNILAIGAHPDDIEYGCGGSLLQFAADGHAINMLVMTKGEQGGEGAVRQREAEKAAKVLGARLFWGGFADTRLEATKATIDFVEKVMKQTTPDLIFVHFPEDTHQDHRHVAQATVTASRYIHNVLFFEVPTTNNFTPGVFMDIEKVFMQKLKLLESHASQVFETKIPGLSIVDFAKSCATFRGFQHRSMYAEGFVPLRFSLVLGNHHSR